MKATGRHQCLSAGPASMGRFQNAARVFARVFLAILAWTTGTVGINITAVDIPHLIRAGSSDPIVLDCNYELGSSSTDGLVIKWFVNQDVLYQWILGKKPSGSEEFQKYIDVSFKASDDPRTMYRAVKLVKPGHELSGNVKCLISTMYAEAEAVRKMLVYSPAKSLRVHHPVLNKTANRLTVTCLAEDLYPRPKIIIHRDRTPLVIQHQRYKNNSHDRFDAEAIGTIFEADKLQLPVIFRCEVSIPEANYTSVQEYVYNGSQVPCISLLILTLNLIVVKRY